MFIDEAKIYVKAGDGGDGCTSFYRDKFIRRGRPDGGPGGDGGDIVFAVDDNVHTLLDFQYRQHFRSESGGRGSSNHKKGHRGKDLQIKVPQGTLIKDFHTSLALRDLVKPGDSVTIAKGGSGGRGNTKDRLGEKGFPGEDKTLILELKLIADVGLIGYPNAGKSTLISRISSAHPKVASYPFTTKEPVLGVVRIHGDSHFVVAEIPGLIEGAHRGKGLGDKFLKHIERTKVLIHLIDIAATEARDPVADYINLNKELELYSKELVKKPQVIALNKVDLPSSKEEIRRFKKHFSKKKAFPISAISGDGLKGLLDAVHRKLKG